MLNGVFENFSTLQGGLGTANIGVITVANDTPAEDATFLKVLHPDTIFVLVPSYQMHYVYVFFSP
jgi:hypothetical protein